MKITGNGMKAAETYSTQAQKNLGKDKQTPKAGLDHGSDRVEISREAREIRACMDALKNEPDIREDLVLEIKKRIQEGTYQPSTEKIVDGIIKELLLDKKG